MSKQVILLLHLGTDGSYLKMGQEGILSYARGDENPYYTDACKFVKEYTENHATMFTSLACRDLKISGDLETMTVTGTLTNNCSEQTNKYTNGWYIEEEESCKYMYVKHPDGRKLFFYISYTDGKYCFGLGIKEDKTVMRCGRFQFMYDNGVLGT